MRQKPFATGNSYGTGRPRGARNRLATSVLKDVLEFWNEPVKEGSTLTKGRATLLTAWRERPTELVKAIFGILPREFLFENVVSELDDTELNAMIEAFREQQRLAAIEQPKMIEHEPRTH